MSRKSKIVHEMVKAMNAHHRFGEGKDELKKEARKLSRETGEKHTAKGVFSYGENSTDATYKKQARTFINAQFCGVSAEIETDTDAAD